MNPDPNTPTLAQAFAEAQRYFWCNTNRGRGLGGDSLEQRMRSRCFAAAWFDFKYEAHIREVRSGDLIFMYANGVGIIAVGYVLESRLEILGHDNPDRMRDFESEGENEEEWRIPVRWLVWDESNPCPMLPPLRPTFTEITDHTERIEELRNHFT